MKLKQATIVASVTMFATTGNAYAVLTSDKTLSIQNDAIGTYGWNETNNTTEWYVSSNGALLDSFFTIGGLKSLTNYGYQYVYMENGADLTLNGSPQSDIAVAPPWYNPDNQSGSAVFHTLGTGISILSASGDTATLDMSGWGLSWFRTPNIPLGSGAWSDGYSNGAGNITCATGSGCALGSTYTLKYTATVPNDDPSFGSARFYFELHGTVGTVPETSTYGMMLAGLGAIGLMVRRREQT